jgi:hypothetical protein
MVQQSSFIPDNLHADLNYSMFLLRKVSLHVQSGGRDAQLVSSSSCVLQCSKIGGITDREKGRQFWAVSDDDHQKSLSVQHHFFKRLETTSLKITTERLKAQVEYEAWQKSDRKKKFDPAKKKLISFRYHSS